MSSAQSLLTPARLYNRSEVLSRPSVVPKESGIYAWYFREAPRNVPVDDAHTVEGAHLLYVGISPKAPPKNGKPPSKQTLLDRVRYHYNGNAEGSTLRLTLGCLLSEQLDIQLRRVGSGSRMTFADGEERLSEWMQENATVCWMIDPEPWIVEEESIATWYLPLNLDKNRDNQFHADLTNIRASAKKVARELPVWNQ